MMYGITEQKRNDAKYCIRQARKFPEKKYLIINNEKIKFSKFSTRLPVNAARYLSLTSEKIKAMKQYAKDQNLVEVFMTITSPVQGTVDEVLLDLKSEFKKIKQRKFWKDINNGQKCYLRIIEPHKNGRPHYHLIMWIPKESVELLFDSLLQKGSKKLHRKTKRKIDIKSEYIPNNYKWGKKGYYKNNVDYKENKKENFLMYIEKIDTSMTGYLAKNIQTIVNNLTLNEQSEEEISDLTAWYILLKTPFFSMSKGILAPMHIYTKVKKYFNLYDLTKLIDANEIRIYFKNNESVDKNPKIQLIMHNDKILWESKNIDIFDESNMHEKSKNHVQFDPNSLDTNDLVQNIQFFGPLSIKIENNHKRFVIINQTKQIVVDDNESVVSMCDKEYNENLQPITNKDMLKGIMEIKEGIDFLVKQEVMSNKQDKIIQIIDGENGYIDVKGFEIKYSISERSQKNLRGRINDPLPFQQLKKNGKIRYLVSDCDAWMKRQIPK